MNVIQKYKNLPVEEIKADADLRRLPFACLISQVEGDFNISTMIRNANAFGAREVFYYGKKQYDKRGTVGTHHYINVNYLSSFEDIVKLKEYYNFVALDILPGISKPLEKYTWKENSLMCFGEEQIGLQKEVLDLCSDIVHITQRGTVPSLNVGTASGIAMFDFSNKWLNLGEK